MSDATIARRTDPIAQALRRLLVWRHPRLWLAYSIAFGVVAPIACFSFLTVSGIGIATIPLDLYVVIATATMAVWLAVGRERPRLNAAACGILFGGALFAAPFALLFSYPGVMLLGGSFFDADMEMAILGALGLQPILAFVAYAVNASRASRANRVAGRDNEVPFYACITSGAIPLAVWMVIVAATVATACAVLDVDRPLAELNLRRWRYLAPGHDWPQLTSAYLPNHDSSPLPAPETPFEHRIAEAFEALTGRSITDIW